MSDEMLRAEELLMKKEYGARLDARELEELELLLTDPKADQQQREIRSTKNLLKQAGHSASQEDDLPGMCLRFEAHVREQAAFVRSRTWGFVLVSFGAASGTAVFFGSILPLYHPKQPGPGDVLALWVFTTAAAACFCAYMYWRLCWMQKDPGVFDRLLKIEHGRPRSVAYHLRRLPILLAAMVWIGWQDGWPQGLIGVPIVWCLFVAMAYGLNANTRRLRLRQDKELWNWWYGQAKDAS